jgi:hypothetical protein
VTQTRFREGRPGRHVGHPAVIPGHPDPPPYRIEPALIGVADRPEVEGALIGRTSVAIGPGQVVLDPENPAIHIIIAADGAAAAPAAFIEFGRDPQPAGRWKGRDMLAGAPEAAALDADIASTPQRSRPRFPRRRLVRQIRGSHRRKRNGRDRRHYCNPQLLHHDRPTLPPSNGPNT